MTHLLTEISITAPPSRIWHLLTDFASYPQWNPFIRRASGEPREGAQLEVYLKPSGARGMTFRPRVLKAESGRELRMLEMDTRRGFEEMNRALKVRAEG
ncbi:MAG: SRPBCC domain-containing protein [Euryarchaeota archaeon]|nr:SRPBCC domain-containing protein [Euryarchaeota archaeon]